MSFDAYEYVGIVVPGTIPILAGAYFYPEFRNIAMLEGIDIGDLGVFIIISFISGHFVHTVANFFEWIEGLCGVGLQDIPFSKNRGGVSDIQWHRFVLACERRLDVHQNQFSRENFNGLRMEIISLLGEENTQRIDIFNRTYGLLRGISAGFILALGLSLTNIENISLSVSLILLGATVLMQIRKRRFAKLYFQGLVASLIAFDIANKNVGDSM